MRVKRQRPPLVSERRVEQRPQTASERALDSLEKQFEERRKQIERDQDQLKKMENQVQLSFEHKGKLTAAQQRQKKIIEALNLTKNHASSQIDEGVDTPAIMVKNPSCGTGKSIGP